MGNDQSTQGCHQNQCASNGVQGWHSNKHAARGARRAMRQEQRAANRAARHGHCGPPVAADAFPWHLVAKHHKIGLGEAKLAVGSRVKIGLGHANVAVCRDLHVGLGNVVKAIVFDKVHVGMGAITELHCLSSTLLTVRLGSVDKVVYHSPAELALLASAQTGVPVPVAAPGPIVTTTTTTVVPAAAQPGPYAPNPAPGPYAPNPASGPYAANPASAPYAATPSAHGQSPEQASQPVDQAPPYSAVAPLGPQMAATVPQDMPPRYDESTEKYTLQ